MCYLSMWKHTALENFDGSCFFFFLLGSYVIIITERECVGSYMGYPIFKVSSLKILHCNDAVKNFSAEKVNLSNSSTLSFSVA